MSFNEIFAEHVLAHQPNVIRTGIAKDPETERMVGAILFGNPLGNGRCGIDIVTLYDPSDEAAGQTVISNVDVTIGPEEDVLVCTPAHSLTPFTENKVLFMGTSVTTLKRNETDLE